MAANKLILLPADPNYPAVATDKLAETLLAIGLIAPARTLGNTVFYPAGKHFLQLLTFLGCSPSIELEPPGDPDTLAIDSATGKFCHIFLDSDDHLRFRADPGMQTPRCSHCRSPLQHWSAYLQGWLDNPLRTNWHCTHCQADGDITTLAFRKSAGFGRTFVEIRGIYPSEAVVGDALLKCLKAITLCDWHTLYIKE